MNEKNQTDIQPMHCLFHPLHSLFVVCDHMKALILFKSVNQLLMVCNVYDAVKEQSTGLTKCVG